MTKLTDFIETHNGNLSRVPSRQLFDEWVSYSGMQDITIIQLTKQLKIYGYTTKTRRFGSKTARAYVHKKRTNLNKW